VYSSSSSSRMKDPRDGEATLAAIMAKVLHGLSCLERMGG
jgi:hypothetical protein